MQFVLKVLFFIISSTVLAAPKYSATAFSRPFTMPQNSFETSLNFSNENIAVLSANYGVTDQFQLGLAWGGLDTGNLPDQKVSLKVNHFLYTTYYVSSMAALTMPFHFNRMVLQEITVAAPVYVHLIKGKLNLVLFEQLVNLNWLEDTEVFLKLSTRLSWQATPSICLNLSTVPVRFATPGIYKDMLEMTPLTFSALYAVTPMLDVVGSLGFADIVTAVRPERGRRSLKCKLE